ncbi:hypothetical protein GCM10027290_30760 [Micromonospora sonneratiae]|uniref:Uncharacterized protein n=1 Tax=Micromonospora sonneratiae TaxID=1184706 RepID=A0ABW3YDK5_9ACTN
MPLYEINGEHLRRHDAARSAALGLYERKDLQRLLRNDIAVLSPDLLVVAEEFGNWEDSRHRVDLLAIGPHRQRIHPDERLVPAVESAD